MTIESVIGISAAEIAAMTNKDLETHFGHYLLVTRPENSPREARKEQQILITNPQFDKARQLAASIGITIPVFKDMRRKK